MQLISFPTTVENSNTQRFAVVYNLQHGIMNQESFKKHLCKQSSNCQLRKEAIMFYHQIDSSLSAKLNGATTLVNMHCMYCGMPKGISQVEAMSNRKKSLYCTLIFLIFKAKIKLETRSCSSIVKSSKTFQQKSRLVYFFEFDHFELHPIFVFLTNRDKNLPLKNEAVLKNIGCSGNLLFYIQYYIFA